MPRGALLAWSAVGVVVIAVAVIVAVSTTRGQQGTSAYTRTVPAPTAVVADATSVPASVYDKVGVTSRLTVNPPYDIPEREPLLRAGGKPEVLYVGAEFCPFCAAERWALVTSLARFGTFTGLKITASSHSDEYPATHTFSFEGSTYTSPYLVFRPVEQVSNIPDGHDDPPYKPLDTLTSAEQRNLRTFEQPPVDPKATKGQYQYPFVNIGDQLIVDAEPFDPGALASLTWSDIAGALRDPANPVTQAIVASSNYLSASVCAATNGRPASVCDSSGVLAAAKEL